MSGQGRARLISIDTQSPLAPITGKIVPSNMGHEPFASSERECSNRDNEYIPYDYNFMLVPSLSKNRYKLH